MKKIFSIVMLLAGWCLASCNEDVQEVVVSHSGEKMSVRAVIGDQPDSRVVLTQKDNGNIKTEWKAGDAFLGVAGSDVISFTDAKLNGSTADFTPNANVEDGTVVNALYPLTEDLATVAASADGFEISLASQNGTLEGLADYTYMTANATAANETLDFTFKHEIVILRLTGMTLPEGVTSVSEVVVSGSGISDVAMANLSGATPTVAVSATDCSVNVKGNFTVTNKVMEDVYVAFFPTSDATEFTVKVLGSDSKPYRYSHPNTVKFEAGNVYTLSEKELLMKYEEGDYYDDGEKEGVVVEVDDDGKHGKIISMDEATQKWRNPGLYMLEPNPVSDKNDGEKNTKYIVSINQQNNCPAFKWCLNKGNDWYLPALNQWTKINISLINEALKEYGGTEIKQNVKYWTSTMKDNQNAYLSFSGSQLVINNALVRAFCNF